MTSKSAHALESIPAGESDAIADLVAFQRRMMEATSPARRGQHAKSHGCVQAELRVHEQAPEELRAGVFAAPQSFPAWVRFSNGFSSDDRNPDVHGVAIKLMGVMGDKIVTDKGSPETQDFLLADHPVFFAPDVRSATDFFSQKVKYDQQGMPPEQAFQELAKLYPRTTPLFLAFVRAADPSPLQTQYWSGVPSLLGDVAVKYLVRPVGNETPSGDSREDSEDFLRLALKHQLTTEQRPAAFEFCVQVQKDPVKMPVEDPTIPWDSPWVPLATLHVPPQDFDTPQRWQFAEDLSFTPWHALPAHRPLGGINRARREVYEMSSQLRHEASGTREFEPSPNTNT